MQRKLTLPGGGTFQGSKLDPARTAAPLRSGFGAAAIAQAETLFDKKFKMRIKSKKTGKEIDINIRFNLKKRDKRQEDIEENPQTLC